MNNSTKQIVGLLLIAIFTAVLLAITFFPDGAGTNQQQFNALMFSLILAVAGMVFIYLGRKEEKEEKEKPQKF
ncbi:hypothetical protein H6776_02880 [Candidatus Nomurabacteria bacterium]|nr:hypothetical protein [Candidatus Nomurabacteria bacterium]